MSATVLTKQNIQACFLEIGYSPLDHIYSNEIQKIMDQLNQEQYDKQTLQEIIDQCKTNSRGQIKIEDLILTFVKAEGILIQRDHELRNTSIKLQSQILSQRGNKSQGLQSDFTELHRLQEQLNEINQQVVLNNINLQIIRKPFNTRRVGASRVTRQQSVIEVSPSPIRIEHPPEFQFPGAGLLASNLQTFTWLFQLCILLTVISLPFMLFHCFYINVMLFGLILLNLVSGYFCRTIIRVWIMLTLFTIIIDIVYFIISARSMWNYYFVDWPHFINPYLKLTVIFYGIISIGKIILLILLASEYNTDQSEKKRVSVFGFYEFELSHDEKVKNFFPSLNKTHSKFERDKNDDY